MMIDTSKGKVVDRLDELWKWYGTAPQTLDDHARRLRWLETDGPQDGLAFTRLRLAFPVTVIGTGWYPIGMLTCPPSKTTSRAIAWTDEINSQGGWHYPTPINVTCHDGQIYLWVQNTAPNAWSLNGMEIQLLIIDGTTAAQLIQL